MTQTPTMYFDTWTHGGMTYMGCQTQTDDGKIEYSYWVYPGEWSDNYAM